jgi:hypothetical protein
MSAFALKNHPPPWFDNLQQLKKIYECGDRVVWIMEDVYILKRTRYTVNSEASTHHFINTRTSIPAPRVYGEWPSPDRRKHFLLEARAPGVTLGEAWPQLTKARKIQLAQQVAGYMSTLSRTFRGCRMETVSGQTLPVNGFVPTAGSKPCGFLHGRWGEDREIFDNEFRPALVKKGLSEAMINSVRATMPPCRGQLALTHCDLYIGNIMVDSERANVTAIIDWESAGYWPEWFQYARITHGCHLDDTEWKFVLSRVSRRMINHADHGRVWLDMVQLLVCCPNSLQARAWLKLLVKYLKGEVTPGEMREYRKLDGHDDKGYLAKEKARLNNRGFKGD